MDANEIKADAGAGNISFDRLIAIIPTAVTRLVTAFWRFGNFLIFFSSANDSGAFGVGSVV